MTRWTPTIRPLAVAAAVLAVAACDTVQSPDTELDSAAAHVPAARVYQADLSPLNAEVSYAPVTGKAMIQVNGDRLTVLINATGLEPGIPHPQHIHGVLGGPSGTCPDMSDDANMDGVIDVLEGLPGYGPIVLTLDSDLTNGDVTEVEGLPVTMNAGGSIHYRQVASYSAVIAGIGADPDLENRHIVLHGVNPDTPLPTAASIGGLPAWLTLPVACGQIDRAN